MDRKIIEKQLKQVEYLMKNPELPQWAWDALNNRLQRLGRLWNHEGSY